MKCVPRLRNFEIRRFSVFKLGQSQTWVVTMVIRETQNFQTQREHIVHLVYGSQSGYRLGLSGKVRIIWKALKIYDS